MAQSASAVATGLTRDAVREIVERSLFLQERMAMASAAVGGGPASRTQTRLAEWKQAAALGDDKRFLRRLAWDGVDMERAEAILGGVKLAPERDLPAWTKTLQDFVEAAAQGTDLQAVDCIRPEEPYAFEDLFLPLILVAAKRVRANAGSALRLLRDQAFASLTRALLRSLTSMSAQALDLEFSVFRSSRQMKHGVFGSWPGAPGRELYRNFIASMFASELASFLREYSVLARFLGTVTDLWVDSTTEFLKRLEQDQQAIDERFSDKAPAGKVVELEASLSDRHNQGRSTIRVRFENDLTLFYKPRDPRPEQQYYDLLEWINSHSTILPFRIFRVLNRTTHGWSEKIAHEPCQSRDEVNRYFQRAGILLCLMYALEASDCHYENIIACGEYPALVDMESLLQPRVRMYEDGEEEGAWSLANRMFFWDSVFRTALLPRWEFGITGESYDVSGLGGVDSQPTSLLMNSWEHVNTDSMRLKRKKVQTQPQQNVVKLAGEQMVPAGFIDQIVSGFEQLYDFLREHSDPLFAHSGPLTAMQDLPVRFIYRHTRVYTVVQKSVFMPQPLRDGAEAGIRLEVLSRPLLHSDQPGPCWEILRAEQKALIGTDIPLFSACAGSTSLFGQGLAIPDFFNMPSFDLLRERFGKLGDADRRLQSSYIRSAFYSRSASMLPAARRVFSTESAIGDLQSEFVAEALKIGGDIRDGAILSSDGTASWITMAYFADANRWQLQPMTPRFYDGTGGTALFLAALHRVTGRDEFRETAQAALRNMRNAFTDAVYERVLFEPGIGAGLGAASVAYSFVRASELLADDSLLDSAQLVVKMMTPDRINADTKLDLMCGAGGAILALLAYYRKTGDREALDKAGLCAARLLAAQKQANSGHRSWPTLQARMITGFSHGAAGIAYALARLFEATGNKAYLEAAREGCAYETGMFDAENRNWPDLRYDPIQGRATFQCSWCHGAPGIALGRAATLEFLDDPDLRIDLDRGLQTTVEYPVADPDHLCCGNLGRADILLETARILNSEAYREHALHLAASVLKRAREEEYSLGWKHGPYLPSFHQGMAGIGYEFLRLAYPDQLPCVLKWD